jgi:hypothetical protein
MCNFLLRRPGMIALLLAAGIAAAAEDPGQAPEPCSSTNIAAYAASSSDRCYAQRATGSVQEPPHLLVKNEALYAGEQIGCEAQAMVTITFCASRHDAIIRGADTPKYIVPNVSGKVHIEDGSADRALRSAQLQPASEAMQRAAGAVQGAREGVQSGMAASKVTQSALMARIKSADEIRSDDEIVPDRTHIALGQTREQVVGVLGKPTKIMKSGTKETYIYGELKVTFVDNKLVQVD